MVWTTVQFSLLASQIVSEVLKTRANQTIVFEADKNSFVLGKAAIEYWCVFGRQFVTPWTAAPQALLPLGILQVRILEWVAMPSARGSSQPRDPTQVSQIAGGFFTA